MRILLIEDDEVLQKMLLQSLTTHHYVVDTVEDGQTGWEYAESTNYDLILLDVGLPKIDGITLCQRLRAKRCSAPILLMTARDASSDRIRGLDAGADDYLIKPLDLGELQARVRALLRRGEVSPTTVLQVGDLRLDPCSCEVTYGEKLVALTSKEYSLLEIFLRNPSRVFSRGQLVEHLWTFDDPPLEESVKAHIKGLRQKLKKAGAVDWIENVYGLGYRLRENIATKEDAPQTREDTQDLSKQLSSLPSDPNSETEWEPRVSPLATSPQSVEQKFQQGLNKLWQQYQGLMTERLKALQIAATAVQRRTLTQELRENARQAAHKLAGVLGMFDREAGTTLARQIEKILLEDEALGQGDKGDNKQPSVREQQLLSLVQELGELLNLPDSKPFSPSKTSRLLLIDPQTNLSQELQELAHSLDLSWKQVATLELAKTWLQSYSPDLVVLAVDDLGQQKDSLALVADLAARTPAIPVLVIASRDGLLDRVTVARAGGQGFLVRSAVTARRVWEIATQLLQRSRSLSVSVLAVDDDPVFLAGLRSMLEPWSIQMTELDDPLRFWEVLRRTAPDLLILDVDMPQLGGIELCQAVRTDPDLQGLPILFLSAHRDRETIQQIFASGADDYVSKPVVAAELLTRITNRLERIRLLKTLSSKDSLTGLANQPQSYRDLELLIQRMNDAEKSANSDSSLLPDAFCLVVFVITELPAIHFQYGHATGNQILQRWGRLFQAAFRGAEVLGYWGNGEFVVGMPGLTKQQTSDRLSEILTTLRQQVFTAPDGSRFQVSFRFGIAEYASDGFTLQHMYQIASKAS